MTSPTDRRLASEPGRLVAPHAMVWVRWLPATRESVWPLLTTVEGLSRWWIVPPSAFELKKGGLFEHHWQNRVAGYKTLEYVDFAENSADFAGTGGMRFELEIQGAGTRFAFLDTWGATMTPPVGPGSEQPGGPGTPWPGVAAGWHQMVDQLVRQFDETAPLVDYNVLCDFYRDDFARFYRWHRMVQRPGT